MAALRKSERSMTRLEFAVGLLVGTLLGLALATDPWRTRNYLLAFGMLLLTLGCLKVLFARERRRLGRYEPAYPMVVRVLGFLGLCGIVVLALYLGRNHATEWMMDREAARIGPARPGEVLVLAVAENPEEVTPLKEFKRHFESRSSRSLGSRRLFRMEVVQSTWLWSLARIEKRALANRLFASLYVTDDGQGIYRMEFQSIPGVFRFRDLVDVLGVEHALKFTNPNPSSEAPALLARAMAEYLTDDATSALRITQPLLSDEYEADLPIRLRGWLCGIAGLAAWQNENCDLAREYLIQAQDEGIKTNAIQTALEECGPEPIPAPVVEAATDSVPDATAIAEATEPFHVTGTAVLSSATNP